MFRAALLAAAALALVACGSNDSGGVVVATNPTVPDGQLTLRWTIDGTTDPAGCTESDSAKIDISIIDPNDDHEIAGFQQDCEAFETTIPLAPGRYIAQARMIDDGGNPRSTDVPVAAFTLVGNDDLVQDVDFPADSFF